MVKIDAGFSPNPPGFITGLPEYFVSFPGHWRYSQPQGDCCVSRTFTISRKATRMSLS